MHEEHLVQAIVEQILQAADEADASRIHRINLEVNTLVHPSTKTLRESLLQKLIGTPAEKAQIRLIPSKEFLLQCTPEGVLLKSIEITK